MAPADPTSDNQPSPHIPAVTFMQADTTFTTRSNTTDAALAATTSGTPPPPKSHSNSAAIIAPVVILLLLALAVVVFFLVRRRRRQQYSQVNVDRSLHQPQPSGSEGNPLLATPIAWPQNGGVSDGVGHSRGLSGDGAPFTQYSPGHELEPSDSDTYASSPRLPRDITPTTLPNRAIPPTSTEARDAILSPTSTYSQSSVSTRVEQEVNGEALASARWTLPPIPRTEPLTEDMLPSKNFTFDLISIYLLSSVSTGNSTSRNPFLRNPSRSRSRGNSLRPRTILPNAPMQPLIENKIASHEDKRPAEGGTNRWSSAADPGGSHPRTTNNNPYSQTSPTATGSGFSFGFGLLTSAFRKSLSASSIASDTTNLHHAYPTHTNLLSANSTRATLQQYPSVDSLGGTSGTGSNSSGGGTYYSAMSMSEFGTGRGHWIGSGSRGSRRDMESIPPSLQPRSRAPSNRNSIATYPSIPSMPSFSMRSSVNTAVPPPLPAALTPGVVRPVSGEGQTITGSSSSQIPFTSPLPTPETPLPPLPPPSRQDSNTDPSIKAHLRPHGARRVVGAQPGLARAGPSTHGVIDVVQRS